MVNTLRKNAKPSWSDSVKSAQSVATIARCGCLLASCTCHVRPMLRPMPVIAGQGSCGCLPLLAQVKYQSRKVLADNRPRVKGRFAKASGGGAEESASSTAAVPEAEEHDQRLDPSESTSSVRAREEEPAASQAPPDAGVGTERRHSATLTVPCSVLARGRLCP